MPQATIYTLITVKVISLSVRSALLASKMVMRRRRKRWYFVAHTANIDWKLITTVVTSMCYVVLMTNV
ncbi:hypothetical protein BV231_15670, partial [Lactiplantibacillus plantarum]